MTSNTVLLVSCGRRKSDKVCRAVDMYNSERFYRLRDFAMHSHLDWYIISAKHGLLQPEEVIKPYDMCIKGTSEEYKQDWCRKIILQLKKYDCNTEFVVLADKIYSSIIVPALKESGYKVRTPFAEKDDHDVAEYVHKAYKVNDVKRLYSDLWYLAEKSGGLRLFSHSSGKQYWPKRGVYFIVDPNESSIVFDGAPRIVRVGTHAVSTGSKSTLWGRLKTHKGTMAGGGNHRGSIFRLHVGNAIINKYGLECKTWAVGQNACKDIRDSEDFLEQMVSSYISKLGIIVLNIDDEPAATSDRAYIEKNTIALLSSLNGSLDFATSDWLGVFSPRNEIVESCLWNINYIDSAFDRNTFDILEKYVQITIDNWGA